jgi:hypothetical protein
MSLGQLLRKVFNAPASAAAFAMLAVDAPTPSSAIVSAAARRMAARLSPVFGRDPRLFFL